MKQRYRTLADYFKQTERPQIDLAREVRVSKSFLSMLVKDERKASPDVAQRIADATGVNVSSLVSPAVAALLARSA